MKILIAVEITNFIYTIILCLAYFSKKRKRSFDTIMFGILIIVSCIGSIIGALNNYLALNYYDTNLTLVRSFGTFYIIYYILYMSIMQCYIVCKGYKRVRKIPTEEGYKKYIKQNVIALSVLTLILCIVEIFIKHDVIYDGIWYYGTGKSVLIVAAYTSIIHIYIIYLLIFQQKKLTINEKVLFTSMLVVNTANALLRIKTPYLVINNEMLSVITLIMYFTIENPDIAVIKKLENANSVKQDFLSSMSHELKTPLNIILGLSGNPSNNETTLKNDMRTINIESLALSELFSNIIDMNTLENDMISLDEKEYNIKNVITPLVDEYNRRLSNKEIELKCFCDLMIPELLIGDYEKLLNATRKLLSNAVKFTEKGSITINVGGEFQKDIYKLRIEVKDTGKGIAKDQYDKIFNEFGKASTDINSATSGIGLGLSICKVLVYAMRGKILLGSEVGVGSTFVIEVPQKIAGAVTVDVENGLPVAQVENRMVPEEAKQLKALIVDDNPLNLEVARKILESQGLVVTTVDNADECLALLNDENKFNYIFMDIMMPEKDGVICMHEIRYLDLPYVPKIIALTADSAIGSKERYLNEGFDDYIEKPLSLEAVKRVLTQTKK